MPVTLLSGSEAMSDKIHGQEGNSPERQLRSLIYAKWFTSDKIRGQEGNSPERQLRSLIYAKWLRR